MAPTPRTFVRSLMPLMPLVLLAASATIVASCGPSSPPPANQPRAAKQPSAPKVEKPAPPAAEKPVTPATPAPKAPDAPKVETPKDEMKPSIEYWEGTKVPKYKYEMRKDPADGKWKRNGFSTAYYSNGVKEREGVYKNNKRVAVWKYYDESGKLSREEDRRDGGGPDTGGH